MCVHVYMVCVRTCVHICACVCVGGVWVWVHACMCVSGHPLQITESAQNKHLILPLKTSNFASLSKPQQNRSARDHNYKLLAHNKQKQLKRSPNSWIRKRLGHTNPTWETLQPSAKRYQRPAMSSCLSSQKASHIDQLENAGVRGRQSILKLEAHTIHSHIGHQILTGFFIF